IAVTGNGHVYVTFRTFEASGPSTDAVGIAKSTDCGKTFAPAQLITTFTASDAQDVSDPQPIPRPQSQRDDPLFGEDDVAAGGRARRSEERRVGKECRARWWAQRGKRNTE